MKSQRLPDIVPEGQLVNRHWLYQRGFQRPDVDYYLRSGALTAVARGLYRKPGPPLKWQNLLFSLQELGNLLHVGGASALNQQGYGHFLPAEQENEIHLYAANRLPSWLEDWHTRQPTSRTSYRFLLHQQSWLRSLSDTDVLTVPFGQWDWYLRFARPETALFELLVEARSEVDLIRIDRYMEALSTLSPILLQRMLALCGSKKARRLMGWFSEYQHHAWFEKLDWTRVDLGSGKLSLIPGGQYDKRWHITVPRVMEHRSEHGSGQPVF